MVHKAKRKIKSDTGELRFFASNSLAVLRSGVRSPSAPPRKTRGYALSVAPCFFGLLQLYPAPLPSPSSSRVMMRIPLCHFYILMPQASLSCIDLHRPGQALVAKVWRRSRMRLPLDCAATRIGVRLRADSGFGPVLRPLFFAQFSIATALLLGKVPSLRRMLPDNAALPRVAPYPRFDGPPALPQVIEALPLVAFRFMRNLTAAYGSFMQRVAAWAEPLGLNVMFRPAVLTQASPLA